MLCQIVNEAARQLWPENIIKACQFHLAQAWWRKIHRHGLANIFKNPDDETGNPTSTIGEQDSTDKIFLSGYSQKRVPRYT